MLIGTKYFSGLEEGTTGGVADLRTIGPVAEIAVCDHSRRRSHRNRMARDQRPPVPRTHSIDALLLAPPLIHARPIPGRRAPRWPLSCVGLTRRSSVIQL